MEKKVIKELNNSTAETEAAQKQLSHRQEVDSGKGLSESEQLEVLDAVLSGLKI
ncbi:MAG: hypothetical protein ACYSR9_12915 [Planctomycetota bacterium]